MFRFTGRPSSGSHSQYLAKITQLIQNGYVELVQEVVSVMAAYCEACVLCTVWGFTMKLLVRVVICGQNGALAVMLRH